MGGQPHAPAASTPGKDPVPIIQEAGWAPGPVWTGGKSRPHRDSIPDRPARSQSLYRLRYPVHYLIIVLAQTSYICGCYCWGTTPKGHGAEEGFGSEEGENERRLIKLGKEEVRNSYISCNILKVIDRRRELPVVERGEMRMAYRHHFGEHSVIERILFVYLRAAGSRRVHGFVWFKAGTSDWMLSTRSWNFGFRNDGKFLPAEERLQLIKKKVMFLSSSLLLLLLLLLLYWTIPGIVSSLLCKTSSVFWHCRFIG